MTEDELFQHIYTLVMNTDVTYKQVDSDMDEEGDVTIFFSGLKAEGDEDDELVLSDYEKGYLTAFYETDAHIQNEHSGRDEDNDWYGVHVGERMFDLCIWKDDDMDNEACVVYECFLNDNGEWNTDTSKQWFLKESKDA